MESVLLHNPLSAAQSVQSMTDACFLLHMVSKSSASRRPCEEICTMAVQALIAFSRVGVYIRLPGVDVDAFSQHMQGGGLLSYIDALSGGSVSRVGIFSLGEFGRLAVVKGKACWKIIERLVSYRICNHLGDKAMSDGAGFKLSTCDSYYW